MIFLVRQDLRARPLRAIEWGVVLALSLVVALALPSHSHFKIPPFTFPIESFHHPGSPWKPSALFTGSVLCHGQDGSPMIRSRTLSPDPMQSFCGRS